MRMVCVVGNEFCSRTFLPRAIGGAAPNVCALCPSPKKAPPVNGGWLARRFASSHLRVRPPGSHLRVRPGSACAHVSHLSQYVVVLARKASYESHCHSLQTCDRQSIKTQKSLFSLPDLPLPFRRLHVHRRPPLSYGGPCLSGPSEPFASGAVSPIR